MLFVVLTNRTKIIVNFHNSLWIQMYFDLTLLIVCFKSLDVIPFHVYFVFFDIQREFNLQWISQIVEIKLKNAINVFYASITWKSLHLPLLKLPKSR